MAIVNIKNGIVERTFYNGQGAAVKEAFTKRDGSEGAQRYSVFFDEAHGLSEGDQGDFSGLLSLKTEEYPEGSGKHYARATLNSGRVQNVQSAGGGQQQASSDDMPF